MKTLLRSLLFLALFCITANAQWVQKHSGTRVNMSDAVSDQIFWAGRWDATAGTFATTDGGQTWNSSTFTDPKGAPVYCIDALNADTAYVVTSEIFKTTDRGNTWVKQITTFSTGFANCIHFFDANNGVATGDPNGGYFEIYTTTNGGDNWVRVPSSNIPAPLPGEVGIVSSFAAHNNTFWFTTSGAANEQRIIRSTDKGYTWTLLTTFQIPSTTTPTIEFRDSLHGLFIGNGYLIFRTSDGGITWTADSLASWVEFIGSPSYIPGTVATYVVNVIGLSGIEELYVSLVSTDDGATWKKMDSWQSPTFNAPSAQEWTSPNSGWMCLVERGIYKWSGYTGKHIWKVAGSVKYGTGVSGEVTDTFAVNIVNFGTLPTIVSSFAMSSTDFTLVNPPSTPVTIQPGSNTELNISFTPRRRGQFHDSLTINSDAEYNNPLSVNFSGNAIAFTPILPDLIYAASDSLYTLTLSNLIPSAVGFFDLNTIEGLTTRPTDSVLIGISTSSLTSTLFRIDPILGKCKQMTSISVGNIRAIAYSNSGILFAGDKSGNLYTINDKTGAATLVGNAAGKDYASFSFNPIDGKLYASVTTSTPKDAIYTIDTSTGATTLVGSTGDAKTTVSIAFNGEGQLYGLKGSGFELCKLISINPATGIGTDIGSLGKRNVKAIIMSKEVIIPVELTSFTATTNSKEVTLNWSTATELNNYGFEIQRKALEGEFATVAFVKGQGTTAQQNDYSFVDKNLEAGKYSYRLKQVDLDGKYEYSKIVEVEILSIISYSLEQNYPNPFNPSTTISYGLKDKSNVKLTLLNSLGEEIAVLVNEEQDKGYHRVDFDGSKLSSGVYFYQLKAGNFVDTKKMILLR